MAVSPNKRAAWKALLGSFVVYLVPVVGPHVLLLFGGALAQELARLGGDRQAWWVAADVALALALQAAAGALLYWFFRRPGLIRLLALFGAAPLIIGFANYMYMLVIPTAFLVEPDTAPERAGWELACAIPNAELAALRSPADLVLERAGETLLLRNLGPQGIQAALLRMPQCEVLDLPVENVVPYMVPGGRLLYQTMERGTSRVRWWYLGGPASSPHPIEEPPNRSNVDGGPILSRDGAWVVWMIGRQESANRRRVPTLLLRSVEGSAEKLIRIQDPILGYYQLVDADLGAGRFLLVRHLRDLVEVGMDGAARAVNLDLAGVEPQPATLLPVGAGFVAWDAYKERVGYAVCWSLPAGAGAHRALNGRNIHSVAADPRGGLLAVSVSRALSIGDMKDAVYVLRSRDGSEVYRKYLPTYTRSQVAFPGPGFFAYTHFDGVKAQVRVLCAPEEGNPE